MTKRPDHGASGSLPEATNVEGCLQKCVEALSRAEKTPTEANIARVKEAVARAGAALAAGAAGAAGAEIERLTNLLRTKKIVAKKGERVKVTAAIKTQWEKQVEWQQELAPEQFSDRNSLREEIALTWFEQHDFCPLINLLLEGRVSPEVQRFLALKLMSTELLARNTVFRSYAETCGWYDTQLVMKRRDGKPLGRRKASKDAEELWIAKLVDARFHHKSNRRSVTEVCKVLANEIEIKEKSAIHAAHKKYGNYWTLRRCKSIYDFYRTRESPPSLEEIADKFKVLPETCSACLERHGVKLGP
jgi:hypothetical protein